MDSHLLLATTDSFFKAFSANQPPLKLLSFFSTTHPVSIQHAPRTCPNPHTSRLHGLNAIRSYFDLLATHFERTSITQHSQNVLGARERTVTTSASVTWRWKKSGRSWNEDFTCTLEFDEHSKICNFVVVTESSPSTCVMRAIDTESSSPSSPSSASPTTAPAPTTARRSSGIIKVASVSPNITSLATRLISLGFFSKDINTNVSKVPFGPCGCARASVFGDSGMGTITI
ncbi:hypothetical protein NP233_g12118 [Leucocoprinus birnbaumii]|uniref:Uncharacterized protein n=1 Tax=Leucocoprinus birnbaumii TaxID=56174 RepID=A0AAD5YQA1_9AGAR|nr:hypothetical protein NP233_g12118 [Leucocoprinus birnbaumii]